MTLRPNDPLAQELMTFPIVCAEIGPVPGWGQLRVSKQLQALPKRAMTLYCGMWISATAS